MSVRTTEGNVQGILGNHYDNATSLVPFIDTASSLVDDIALLDSSISATRLELIERWLAAHYYEHADQITQSRSTGGASGQFQGRTDMGFDSTKYGQEAKRLDSSGMLVNLDQPLRPKAGGFWLGKARDDQLDVDERTT
jgi:hypothetical protein